MNKKVYLKILDDRLNAFMYGLSEFRYEIDDVDKIILTIGDFIIREVGNLDRKDAVDLITYFVNKHKFNYTPEEVEEIVFNDSAERPISTSRQKSFMKALKPKIDAFMYGLLKFRSKLSDDTIIGYLWSAVEDEVPEDFEEDDLLDLVSYFARNLGFNYAPEEVEKIVFD